MIGCRNRRFRLQQEGAGQSGQQSHHDPILRSHELPHKRCLGASSGEDRLFHHAYSGSIIGADNTLRINDLPLVVSPYTLFVGVMYRERGGLRAIVPQFDGSAVQNCTTGSVWSTLQNYEVGSVWVVGTITHNSCRMRGKNFLRMRSVNRESGSTTYNPLLVGAQSGCRETFGSVVGLPLHPDHISLMSCPYDLSIRMVRRYCSSTSSPARNRSNCIRGYSSLARIQPFANLQKVQYLS